MGNPDVLRVCFFTIQGVPMLAVGRQEKDRLRVVKLLEDTEALLVYKILTDSSERSTM